jgi:hypothetical protein
VVETHATPLRPGRTAVVEATLATSPRSGFAHASKVSRLVRPFIERSARRLWVDDAAYAERLAQLELSEVRLAPPARTVAEPARQLRSPAERTGKAPGVEG